MERIMRNTLNACFVGYGSIGKRHIKNLKSICAKRGINLSISLLRHCKNSNSQTTQEFTVYSDISELPNNFDVIFITNPTKYHFSYFEKLINKGKHFFIEKPICTPYYINKFSNLKFNNDCVYYVACPLRYTSLIQYLKDNLNTENVISIRAICSSYLPNWRPNIDYRKSYSAIKELGGGVDLDLIHEWDYIKYIFGQPTKIQLLKSKISNLEIDAPDIAIYIARIKDLFVEIHLDYFGRKDQRILEIYTNDDFIECDLIKNQIHFYKTNEVISFNEERDDYQTNELNSFLDMIYCNKENTNGISQALETLKLTQGKL